MKPSKFCMTVAACVVVAVCTGCGSESKGPVEGVVTLDGKPLANATVTLRRTEVAATEGVYLAETDVEGKYRLVNVHGGSPGAPSGSYSVFIKSVKAPPGADESIKLAPERVPGKWRDGSQTIDIPPGGTTEADFAITTR